MTSPTRTRSGAKKLEWQFLLTAVALWLPIIVGRLAFGASAMTMLIFGTLAGLLGTMVGGRRVGSATVVAFLLSAPVAIVAGQDPIAGMCLMALASLLIGGAAYYKRYGGFNIVLVGILFVVTAPAALAGQLSGGIGHNSELLKVLLGTALCGFWPVLIVPFMNAVADVPLQATYAKLDTIRYAVALAVLVSTTTLIALTWGKNSHGVWLPLTLIMVMQVEPGTTPHRTAQRMYGTVLGALVAAVLATYLPGEWASLIVMLVATLGMVITGGHEPYGRFVFFLTILVLMGVSAGEPALEATFERIVYTALGCAIALGAYYFKITVAGRAAAQPSVSGA